MNKSTYPVKINKSLLPLSCLYGLGVRFRNLLFDWKLIKQKSYKLPVICIGNLTVGGTGKTPHTEYLLRLLADQYHTAVLSRGYKRKTKGFLLASDSSTALDIGDEPYQIQRKFPRVRVAVDANRQRGMEHLLQLNDPQVEAVLLDDAYQHRYVKAGMNILLTDFYRLFCDDKLLPAGRLREPKSGKDRAHIVIVTKCPDDVKPIDFNIITKRLNLYPFQDLFFSRFKYGDLEPVFASSTSAPLALHKLAQLDSVLVVTGIAKPSYLKAELSKHNEQIDCLTFKDHYQFTEQDIQNISKRFESLEGADKILITTEKDAVRLLDMDIPEALKKHIYALPIQVEILQDKQTVFNQKILDYVTKNTRNS